MRTRRILPLLLLLAAVLAVPAARAADQPEAPDPAAVNQEVTRILDQPAIDLEDLFSLVELANPRLAVSRLDVAAQAGRARQAGLYPNPELAFSVDEMSVDDPDIHKTKVKLSQALLIGGRRGASVDAAQAALQAADQQALQAKRAALVRAHRLWAEQLHFREAAAAFDELEVALERSLQIARARFEAKAAPESHVTRALLEAYELEVARNDLARERVRSTAMLRALLGGLPVPVDRLAGSLDPGMMEAAISLDVGTAPADHPALRAASFDIAAADAAVEVARKERIPDLNLFVTYGRFAKVGGNFVEGGIALPLPLFDRNQGKVAENRALAAQARHSARIVASELEIAVAGAQLRHRQVREQLETLTVRVEPAAARGLDQAQEAYRTGRIVFLELVDAQRTFTDVRLKTLELRRDLAMSEADLMSLLGAGPYADTGDER